MQTQWSFFTIILTLSISSLFFILDNKIRGLCCSGGSSLLMIVSGPPKPLMEGKDVWGGPPVGVLGNWEGAVGCVGVWEGVAPRCGAGGGSRQARLFSWSPETSISFI